MARFDKIHNAVKNALVKDGWTITSENLRMRFKGITVFFDIAAERPVVIAERGGERIIVEIKSFLGRSAMSDFEKALGQYKIYKLILIRTEPATDIYLAVPKTIYTKFFAVEGIRFIIKEEKIRLLVVDVEQEEVVQWTK